MVELARTLEDPMFERRAPSSTTRTPTSGRFAVSPKASSGEGARPKVAKRTCAAIIRAACTKAAMDRRPASAETTMARAEIAGG